MARGYPDDFGQSIWPKYGSPQPILVTHTINAGTTLTFDVASANGVLTALDVHVIQLADERTHRVDVLADNATLFRGLLSDMIDDKLTYAGHSLFDLIYYNALDFTFIMRLRREIPFNDSISMYVENNSGSNVVAFTATGTYYVVQ